MGALGHYTKNPQRILLFLESLRRSLIGIGSVVLLFSSLGYFTVKPTLSYLQGITNVPLAAFGIPETFLALLNLALASGVFISIPYILYKILSALSSLFQSFSRKMMVLFLVGSILLFYTGAFFCLKVSLPYGAKFLVSYESADVQALISVRKFVSFCTLFIFGFGMIFQVPLVMMLLGRLGILKIQTLVRSRRYAVLAITVISAVLTPTPDVVNMMLMAVPLYLLFEMGILGMRLWRK